MDGQKKKVSDMSVEEILRQQLEILAERSQSAATTELPGLTDAIIKIFQATQWKEYYKSFT